MGNAKEVTEFDLLALFVEQMETEGVSRKFVRLDLNGALAGRLAEKIGVQISEEQLLELGKRCLANEWLEHTVLGAGQFGQLALTASGHGVVRSRALKAEALRKRTLAKKVSDYIETHKGLLAAIAASIALAGVLIRLLTVP